MAFETAFRTVRDGLLNGQTSGPVCGRPLDLPLDGVPTSGLRAGGRTTAVGGGLVVGGRSARRRTRRTDWDADGRDAHLQLPGKQIRRARQSRRECRTRTHARKARWAIN